SRVHVMDDAQRIDDDQAIHHGLRDDQKPRIRQQLLQGRTLPGKFSAVVYRINRGRASWRSGQRGQAEGCDREEKPIHPAKYAGESAFCFDPRQIAAAGGAAKIAATCASSSKRHCPAGRSEGKSRLPIRSRWSASTWLPMA